MIDFPELVKVASIASLMNDSFKFYRKYNTTYDHVENAVDPTNKNNVAASVKNKALLRSRGPVKEACGGCCSDVC